MAPRPATADAELGRVTMHKVSRRLLPYLFMLYVVNYLDRVNVSFAALGMNRDLGFSATTYGLGAGLFFAGYVSCQMPANLVLLRVGARRWISALLVAWGLAAASLAFITDRSGFYVLRVCLGIAEAGFFPGVMLYLSLWFPAAERARAVGRFMIAIPIAGILGGPLSGALLGLHGVGGIAGWRWLFLLEALPAIILGVVTLRYLTDRPSEADWLRPDERAWLTEELQHENLIGASRKASVREMLGSGTVWILAVVSLLFNFSAYGMTFWLPQVLQALSGASALTVGLLTAIPYVVVVVAVLAVSARSDRTGERFLHTGIPFAVAGVGLLIAASSRSLPLSLLGLSIGLAGYGAGSYGPFWSLPGGFLRGAGAAAGVAFINAVGNMGGFFGPYLVGATKDETGGFGAGLSVLALLMLAAGAITIALRQTVMSGRSDRQAPPWTRRDPT